MRGVTAQSAEFMGYLDYKQVHLHLHLGINSSENAMLGFPQIETETRQDFKYT